GAVRLLDAPAARLIARGEERPLLLEEVEALQASDRLVVDACRYVVRDSRTAISLARRPVLFALARALGEAGPATCRGTGWSRAPSAPSRPTPRIAPGCGSRSGGCAPRCARWPASTRPSTGLR